MYENQQNIKANSLIIGTQRRKCNIPLSIIIPIWFRMVLYRYRISPIRKKFQEFTLPKFQRRFDIIATVSKKPTNSGNRTKYNLVCNGREPWASWNIYYGFQEFSQKRNVWKISVRREEIIVTSVHQIEVLMFPKRLLKTSYNNFSGKDKPHLYNCYGI